jgi:hypothetical protein
MQLAIIAIQSTLTDIAEYYDLPMERVEGATITLHSGVRVYQLPADFVQFWNNPAYFYDAVQNNMITEFKGGEKTLARVLFDYKTESGYPQNWYYIDAPTKEVGFFQVPNDTLEGRVLTFDYNKDVIPTVETDLIPLIRNIECLKFCELAAVRFNALFTQQPRMPGTDFEKDPTYVSARATLLKLVRPTKPGRRYGRVYAA